MTPDTWWRAFHDPVLNDLEERATQANQNLKVASARFQDSYALAQVARAAFFPTLQALFNADRQKNSITVANAPGAPIYNQVLVGGYLSYELDAWGSVRNEFISAQHLAKASAADVATVYLSIHAQLANDYFTLRGYDEQQSILDKTVLAYQQALYLTKQRFQGGVAAIVDVDEAQTQLENTKTLAEDNRLKRAQMEHAIAVLIGEIPSSFSLAHASLPKEFIAIKPSIPSALLLNRPDIVAAEQRVQSANAQIGVARAAFFPQFNITGSGGAQSSTFSNLIRLSIANCISFMIEEK